jgi:CRISPR-associated protein Cmr1
MSQGQSLVATFEIVTPIFCAGADQNGPAEPRAFSFRGNLRWFYRALDSGFRKNEGAIFGATSSGQAHASPISLVVMEPAGGWGSRRYHHELPPKEAMQKGECYLGYTFYLGENNRQAAAPGKRFQVRLEPTWDMPQQKVLQAWVASLWLLGTLGGIGSRCRRGFGTCALVGLGAGSAWPIIAPINAQTPEEWLQKFKEGFAQIREWFPYGWKKGEFHHQVLPRDLSPLVSGRGFRDWKDALRDIGNKYRQFRNKYRSQKDKIASLGLPLTSRSKGDTLVPKGGEDVSERSASRLWIRVLKLGEMYYPMVWHCEGPLIPPNTTVVWKKTRQPEKVEEGLRLIYEFFSDLRKAGYK